MRIKQIISGGQTGADRAALDAAIDCGVPHGGWCPSGRRAEDGRIHSRYQLQETKSVHYAVRTKANVVDADLTLIFSYGPLSGGSLLTKEFAAQAGKPCIHIDLLKPVHLEVILNEAFPNDKELILNVAGARKSSDPQIYQAVYNAVRQLLEQQSG